MYSHINRFIYVFIHLLQKSKTTQTQLYKKNHECVLKSMGYGVGAGVGKGEHAVLLADGKVVRSTRVARFANATTSQSV